MSEASPTGFLVVATFHTESREYARCACIHSIAARTHSQVIVHHEFTDQFEGVWVGFLQREAHHNRRDTLNHDWTHIRRIDDAPIFTGRGQHIAQAFSPIRWSEGMALFGDTLNDEFGQLRMTIFFI